MIIVALLMTWAVLVKTEPALTVGPIYLHETFAQVQKTLGPASVTKSNCDASNPETNCFPTLTYTDGSNTVTITAESLYAWPQKVDPRSQNVEVIEIIRGRKPSATIQAPGIRPIDTWTWESSQVFSQPPQGIAGWKRSKSDNGDVFFDKIICGFTEGGNPPGQLQLQGWWATAPGERAFTLHYIGFGERC